MKLSAEERIMYKVMKALYDSGIPVNFKGSMVLKACLMEAGFSEDTRHTVVLTETGILKQHLQVIRWRNHYNVRWIKMTYRLM